MGLPEKFPWITIKGGQFDGLQVRLTQKGLDELERNEAGGLGDMADEKQTETTKESTPGRVVETSRTTETTLGPKVETTTVERKDETTTKVERE